MHMAQSGAEERGHRRCASADKLIIDELIRQHGIGRLELGYSILLALSFQYLSAPRRFQPLSQASRTSSRKICPPGAHRPHGGVEQEGRGFSSPNLRFAAVPHAKECRIAQSTWWIEFFSDGESAVPPGDVEIHSELNDIAQPGYHGTKTTLIERQPSVAAGRVVRDRESTRRHDDRVYAEIHYSDDSGPQTYFITQNEVSVGRGGDGLWVDLPLYASDHVSREHLRLRRDPATGAFVIADQSRNGTWLNGRRLQNGAEAALPDRAEIRIAEAITLNFEVRK